MEGEDLAQLSKNIEAAQARLQATMAELRHEAQPKVVAGHARDKVTVRVKSLVVTPTGAVRVEAIVAGVVAVAAISALIVFGRRR